MPLSIGKKGPMLVILRVSGIFFPKFVIECDINCSSEVMLCGLKSSSYRKKTATTVQKPSFCLVHFLMLFFKESRVLFIPFKNDFSQKLQAYLQECEFIVFLTFFSSQLTYFDVFENYCFCGKIFAKLTLGILIT